MNSVVSLPQAPLPRAIIGFLAGFLATLTFHQLVILALPLLGINAFPAYALRAIPPLGIPLFINLAFWGGVWGILFVFIVNRFPKSIHPWLAGALFGILLPTLAGWTIIAALKGQPLFSGFNIDRILAATIANSVWGACLPIFSSAMTSLLPKR